MSILSRPGRALFGNKLKFSKNKSAPNLGKKSSMRFSRDRSRNPVDKSFAPSSWWSCTSFEACVLENAESFVPGFPSGLAEDDCSCRCEEHENLCSKIPIFPMSNEFSPRESYSTTLMVANSLIGKWVTILDRSDTLDAHYKAMGVNFVKRAIMNRLAVQLTITLDAEKTNLHTDIHTPQGDRSMECNLKGEEYEDADPDCGRWIGTSRLVNFSVPWFCENRPVRALQQVRHNKQAGVSVTTRCVLPDATEGTVLLFHFRMMTKKGEELNANRILKRI